jgi:uncharacterized lipoprotein
MKIRNIAVTILVLSMLAACSTDKQRIDYKSSVSQVSPLEIPPDLTTIAASDQFAIPGARWYVSGKLFGLFQRLCRTNC